MNTQRLLVLRTFTEASGGMCARWENRPLAGDESIKPMLTAYAKLLDASGMVVFEIFSGYEGLWNTRMGQTSGLLLSQARRLTITEMEAYSLGGREGLEKLWSAGPVSPDCPTQPLRGRQDQLAVARPEPAPEPVSVPDLPAPSLDVEEQAPVELDDMPEPDVEDDDEVEEDDEEYVPSPPIGKPPKRGSLRTERNGRGGKVTMPAYSALRETLKKEKRPDTWGRVITALTDTASLKTGTLAQKVHLNIPQTRRLLDEMKDAGYLLETEDGSWEIN